ncbi:MAG: PD-(D/E)XK nuclease family protein [Robiginitomaculum sp.]|nr:PD-(D/E)XK nuclease family protein [Robiginitomaculum sp.]
MEVSQDQIKVLAVQSYQWRQEFDRAPLQWYGNYIRGIIFKGMPGLIKLSQNITPVHNISALESIFGKFVPHHSFYYLKPDWKFHLSEPDATKTFAHVLNQGAPDIRASRIQAFLKALGLIEIPDIAQLHRAKVMAEQDRIDLEIRWPLAKTGKWNVVLVEAKFGHTLTQGQLTKYRRARQAKNGFELLDCFLLVLKMSKTDKKYLKIESKYKNWEIIYWDDLWLRFEKYRPDEDNANLSVFLNLLWQRIGGLK